MKYIISVLMVIPMYYFSFTNNFDFTNTSCLSGSISATLTNAIEGEGCSNGTIELEIDNANGPFHIEWSNGASTESLDNLSPGEYCVTITDDSCGEAIGCWEINCCPFILDNNQIEYNITNPACEGQKGELELSLLEVEDVAFPMNIYLENLTDNTKYDLSLDANYSNLTNLSEGNYTAQINYGEGCSNKFEFDIIFQAIEIQFEKTAACDNDGTITVNATFGKLPYNYDWSDGESSNSSYRQGLSSGFYKVTVSDANLCMASASVYVKKGEPITTENMSVFVGSSNCFTNSGVIDIYTEPEGGSPPFYYTWSNGQNGKLIENLPGGDYQLTITDELGCSTTAEYTIPVEGQPIINNVIITHTCKDQNTGEIGILASSATGGQLTYSWSNGSTDFILENLYKGSYTVTITDISNNCPLVKTYVVEELSPDPLVITESIKNNCESEGNNNGEISLNISGGKMPYNIVWNTGQTTFKISDLSPGEYSATINDYCGNVEYYSYNITSEQINVNIDLSYPNFEELILEAKVYGGNEPYEYLWNTGSELFFIVEEDDGNYSVTVTDQNGCTKSESIEVVCEPKDFQFITTPSCSSLFKLKIGNNSGVGPGPFLVKVEKKINQTFSIVDYRILQNVSELLNYEFIDLDLGVFKVTVTNYCGYSKTETFTSCVDCDYYFFNEEEEYFASALGDLLFFQLVCPCSNDCGLLGLTTDKIKLILQQSALEEFSNEIGGFPSFKITWPNGESNVSHNANSGQFNISGPSEYTLTDDEFENGITIHVSISLPYGVGEVCNLSIPFEFGQEGYNGYFKKWTNPYTDPFINHDPPYNFGTVACPYKCTIPVINGVLYANEPIDEIDESQNYNSKCSPESIYEPEYFFYQPNDYTNPCNGGGFLLTHYESVVGVVSGQRTIPPNVAIDAYPYWPYDMLEENDPSFPYTCPPHIYEKGYCLFDSRDVYGEDVILRDPILASYCKDRVYDPPIDTDGDGLPDTVDPCPLNPDVLCLEDDGNNDEGGSNGSGGTDDNGCQTTFLPDQCKLAIVCPDEGITYIDGIVTNESYSGMHPCVHCFSVDVCRVTNPVDGEEFAKAVGPISGSVTLTIGDIPECSNVCAIIFTCTQTGEFLGYLCSADCQTSTSPLCQNYQLNDIISLLMQEDGPEAIEIEMTPEIASAIISSKEASHTLHNSLEELKTSPNPSGKKIMAQYTSNNSSFVTLEVRNLFSELIYQKQIAVKKGINQIEVITDLLPGVYVITVNNNGNQVSTKHVIQY